MCLGLRIYISDDLSLNSLDSTLITNNQHNISLSRLTQSNEIYASIGSAILRIRNKGIQQDVLSMKEKKYGLKEDSK